MKFLIITHVIHSKSNNHYFGYAPYVREMNIWLKYVDKLMVVAPLENKKLTEIEIFYEHPEIDFRPISNFSITTLKNVLRAVFIMPKIIIDIFKTMQQADHIHLRCPGNIGLLGCFVQMFFPNKPKSAKYAGNWDPKAKQPWTYRLQKWILSNSFLTRNMKVLVYGEWENQSRNILPFFTATYAESEIEELTARSLDTTIRFIFVGTLTKGKNPLYAIQVVEKLAKKGCDVFLNIYGEGGEREILENYITQNKLKSWIYLHGNQTKKILKEAYQESHFVILPSQSEGWPKAIAEGMFWGCVPIATPISCVPNMLNHGERGVLLQIDLENDVKQIEKILANSKDFNTKSKKASQWSRKYTIEVFEKEIKSILLN